MTTAKKLDLMQYKGGKTKMDKATMDHLDQKGAKTVLPPDSYMWRSRTDNAWCSRYNAYPVKSCGDQACECESNALAECLMHAWWWYLEKHGLAISSCPIRGFSNWPIVCLALNFLSRSLGSSVMGHNFGFGL